MGVYGGRFQSQNPVESKLLTVQQETNPLSKGGKRSEDAGLLGHQSRFRFIQVVARTVENGGCRCICRRRPGCATGTGEADETGRQAWLQDGEGGGVVLLDGADANPGARCLRKSRFRSNHGGKPATGQGEAGLAWQTRSRREEEREKTDEGVVVWESEVSHSHRRRVPWAPSLVPLVPLGCLELSSRCRAEGSMAEPRHGRRRNKRGGSAGSGSGHEAWVGEQREGDVVGHGRGGTGSGRHDVVGRGVMVGSLGAAALTALSETSDGGV